MTRPARTLPAAISHGADPRALVQASRRICRHGDGAGIRPCTGAIILLVFALSKGLFLAGALSVAVMALGTALGTSLFALLAVKAKLMALNMISRTGRGWRGPGLCLSSSPACSWPPWGLPWSGLDDHGQLTGSETVRPPIRPRIMPGLDPAARVPYQQAGMAEAIGIGLVHQLDLVPARSICSSKAPSNRFSTLSVADALPQVFPEQEPGPIQRLGNRLAIGEMPEKDLRLELRLARHRPSRHSWRPVRHQTPPAACSVYGTAGGPAGAGSAPWDPVRRPCPRFCQSRPFFGRITPEPYSQ